MRRSSAANFSGHFFQRFHRPALEKATLCASALLLAVVAFAQDGPRRASVAPTPLPQVVVTGKRPATPEKDIPKVVVTAKRMTDAQKRAYDEAQARASVK